MEKSHYIKFLASLNNHTNSIMKIISLLLDNDQRIGFIFAKTILIRLRSTFDAAKSLIKNGYAIEAFILIRFIQEQVSYSYSLYSAKNKDDLDKISVTKSIKKYKKRIEYFGNIYGEMTKFVHMSINQINFFTDFSIYDTMKPTQVSVILAHDDNELNDMLWNYGFAVMIYMDIMFVLLDGDNNIKLQNRAEKVKQKIYSTIYNISKYEKEGE